MTSFSAVLDLAHTASVALTALEGSTNSQVLSAFAKYENGFMTYGQLRIEIPRIARTAFLTSGALAVEHVSDLSQEAGLARLDTPVMSSSPVLDRILEDIQRNLESFRDSERTATDLRRLRFRAVLSAQTAARRGFTENQLELAGLLRDQGASLKKVWMANFVNNTPCLTCLALHGSEISLSEEFDHGTSRAPKTFMGLQGPPRHPNCHCYMLVYVVTLDTVAVVPEAPILQEQKFMSAKDVRKLPRSVYTSAITTLRIIAGILKGAIRGKR